MVYAESLRRACRAVPMVAQQDHAKVTHPSPEVLGLGDYSRSVPVLDVSAIGEAVNTRPCLESFTREYDCSSIALRPEVEMAGLDLKTTACKALVKGQW